MKLLLSLAAIFVLTISAEKCSPKKDSKVYTGKLEIKAMCMNYTVTVLDGPIDTSKVVASWTDESTGKTYQNAFGLADPCSFPSTIQQGQEFKFIIDDTAKRGNCAVCMAYYPTPSKKLMIKVVE